MDQPDPVLVLLIDELDSQCEIVAPDEILEILDGHIHDRADSAKVVMIRSS